MIASQLYLCGSAIGELSHRQRSQQIRLILSSTSTLITATLSGSNILGAILMMSQFNQPTRCLLMCSDRWSLRENFLSQSLHLNGLSPVCLRKCRVNSSLRANFHWQSSQEQEYGFSPVCVRLWALRWELFVYTFLHPGKSQTCCRFGLLASSSSPLNCPGEPSLL